MRLLLAPSRFPLAPLCLALAASLLPLAAPADDRPVVADRTTGAIPGVYSFTNTIAFGPATTVTLAGGEITPTVPVIAAAPEALAADDLTTVHAARVGQVLWLTVADPATNVIVVRHGTGNLSLPGAQDITLTEGAVQLISQADGSWRAVGGGGGSSGASTAAEVSVAATPSNYTAATPDVEAHLAGIDTALGTLSGGGGGETLAWSSSLGSYRLVDYTVPSDATTVTLSGWTLAAGRHYRLLVDLKQDGGGSSVAIQINGDTNSSNYRTERTVNTGGTVSGASVASNALWAASSNTEYLLDYTVSITPDGYAQLTGQAASTVATTGHMIHNAIRRTSATVTGITSLALVHSTASGIKAGTRIRLYELRDVQGGSYAPRWDVPAIDQFNASLAAYWPLSEWSSTRYDYTRAIALNDTNTVGWTTGVGGNGVAALFVRANSEYLTAGAPKRTMTTYFASAWIKVSTTGIVQGVWGASTAATYAPVWIFVTNTNNIEASVGHNSGASLAYVDGTTSIVAGTWYHVAVWCDSADKVHLYINGAEEGTAASLTAPLAACNGSLYLGAYYDGGLTSYLDGAIAHAALWCDLPFTSTEAAALAAALYNSGVPAQME